MSAVSMTNTIGEYRFGDSPVRAVILNGIPYLVAKDVCAILGISNHKDAVSRLDDDEKGRSVLPTQFGNKATNLVNESGLYHLIFQSRKPEAKLFRRWVTSEVLPELRRTGTYITLPNMPFQYVNDRKMYPFHEMAMKLGYKSAGSLYDKAYRYAGQFVKIGHKLYASEDMCRLMAASRNTYLMRKEVNELEPVLAIEVSQLSLPFIL